MPVTGVKVAVRVRPFNSREKSMKAQLCVNMPTSQKVLLTDPKDSSKVSTFLYDYAYWSHDEAHPFAGQDTVYKDIGHNVLENAFAGYNYTLLAYGQTGSGKSYSMTGPAADPGIIPRACTDLYKRIDALKADPEMSGTEFQTTVSFLEIYNEKLKDLLATKASKELKIRQDPKTGVFVQNLSYHAVSSEAEIQKLLEAGDKNRAVAATNMNATSSRSHSVFTITLKQLTPQLNEKGEEVGRYALSSTINLIDLAGSERAASTGAVAGSDRFAEGVNINKSLTTLGMVIESLAFNSSAAGKSKPRFVPYRDSQLTHLLQNALGGNSMTCMVAAISPASVNYDETLSTLRYAERASKIENAVTKNETAQEKYIRELEDRVKELEAQLKGGSSAPAPGSASTSAPAPTPDAEEALAKLEEYRRQIDESNAGYARQLQDAQHMQEDLEKRLTDMGMQLQYGSTLTVPNIVNLHEDPAINGTLTFPFGTEADAASGAEVLTVCGSATPDSATVKSSAFKGARRIVLPGILGVGAEHFLICNTNTVVDAAEAQAKGLRTSPLYPRLVVVFVESITQTLPVYLNGALIEPGKRYQLLHGDRLMCGASIDNSFVRYDDPVAVKAAADSAKENGSTFTEPTISWDQAQTEYLRRQAASRPASAEPAEPAQQATLTPTPAAPSDAPQGADQPPQSSFDRMMAAVMQKLYPLVCEANAMAKYFDYDMTFAVEVRAVIEPDVRSNMKPSKRSVVEIAVSAVERDEYSGELVSLRRVWSTQKFMTRVAAMKGMYAHAIDCGDKAYAMKMARDAAAGSATDGDEYCFALDNEAEVNFTAHLIGTYAFSIRDFAKKALIAQKTVGFADSKGKVTSEVEVKATLLDGSDGGEGTSPAPTFSTVSAPTFTIRFYIGRVTGLPASYTRDCHVVAHAPYFVGNASRPEKVRLTEHQENLFRSSLLQNGLAKASPPARISSINPSIDNYIDLEMSATFLHKKDVATWLATKGEVLLSLYAYTGTVSGGRTQLTQIEAPKPIAHASSSGQNGSGKLVIKASNIIKAQTLPDKIETINGEKVILRKQIIFVDVTRTSGGSELPE